MGVLKFGAGKFGISLACTVVAFGIAGVAQADFVKTVTTEAECTENGGDVMDLNGVNHCFIALNEFKNESEADDYASELTGVTTCAEKNIRKSKKAGDFCLIKLEDSPDPVETEATETPEITDVLTDIAKDQAEK